MYESFFNFHCKPFDLLPNPEFIFPSKIHRRAHTYLDYGIHERAGFILLTGDVGCGKTTLIRSLLRTLDDRVILSRIFNTKISSEQLLAMINDDFGLPVEGKDRIALLRDLNDFLVAAYSQGKFPVLLIDEAQNLGADLLEEIRLLSNLETDEAKLLQIILVGQPELRDLLSRPELRQLRQRIGVNCHLHPLEPDEVGPYLLHRLEVAGNRRAVVFEDSAVAAIHAYSSGVPRLINIMADFLLLSAFAEEEKVITGDMVCDVAGDIDFSWSSGSAPPAACPVPAAVATEVSGSDRAALEEVLSMLSRRLDRLDETISVQNDDLGKLTALVADLAHNVADHQCQTQRMVVDLRDELAAAAPEDTVREAVGPDAGQAEKPRPSLLRRMFGQ